MRGATSNLITFASIIIISIHAPHAGRDARRRNVFIPYSISIHAPHAGRDFQAGRWGRGAEHFNPRAPCGARLGSSASSLRDREFQSTRPMRGATKKTLYIVVVYIFQSTRPMRGATCGLLRRYVGAVRYFNPRAPCGARLNQNNVRNFAAYFNPRAPCGARRFRRFCWRYGRPISIHAPHAGRDSSMLSTAATVERFQSTRPMRGATGTISPLFTF